MSEGSKVVPSLGKGRPTIEIRDTRELITVTLSSGLGTTGRTDVGRVPENEDRVPRHAT